MDMYICTYIYIDIYIFIYYKARLNSAQKLVTPPAEDGDALTTLRK